MKLSFLSVILLLSLFLFLPAPFRAQTASPSVPPAVPAAANTEPLGEDEHLPFMKDEHAQTAEPSTINLAVRTIGAMLLIVSLIFFAAWGMKKFNLVNLGAKPAIDSPDLAVLNTISIGNNRTLSVVRFGARTLLIGSTAQSLTLLADEKHQEQQTFARSSGHSVAELLAAQNAGYAPNVSFEDELSDAEYRLSDFEDDRRQI